ncbi:MAG TPA: efflux RND transporter periplasmic adaptor subunit, partial [Geobacteraceae bacterium]
VEKYALEGQYVSVGEPLFTIADLSQIWIDLELFESDFSLIRVGQEVSVVSQSYPGQEFHGKVAFLYPFFDPKTRTVKVRVTLQNPGLRLKPDMYVTATIRIPQAQSLVVPAQAVLDTGKRQLVWVETGPGVFTPRDVQTGGRSADMVQVIAGLRAGEKIASSGAYLIDSEAQLNRASEAPPAPAANPPRTNGPEKGVMKMPEVRK